MKARKFVTFVTALTLTANAFTLLPTAADEEETFFETEASADATTAVVDITDAIQGTTEADEEETFFETEASADATEADEKEIFFVTEASADATEAPKSSIKTSNDIPEIHIIDSAVLYVPYSYLLFPMNSVPQSTEISTATESTTTESTTTETTSTSASASTSATTSETTTSTTVNSPESIEEWCHIYWQFDDLGAICIMDYDGADLVGQNVKSGDMDFLTVIPSSVEAEDRETHEKEIIKVGTADVTNSWWFKATLGTVRIPNGIKVVKDGEEITYDELAELLKPAGNTLEIVESTYMRAAAPSLSDHSIIVANDGEWFYDDVAASTTAMAVDNDALPVNTIYYRIPAGLTYYPESSELYGVPQETGTFIFSVTADAPAADGAVSSGKVTYTYELTVKENTNLNVYSESDVSYSILNPIGTDHGGHDYVLEAPVESVFRSEGEFGQFVDVWLNGKRLERGVDYDAESGSTVMTIYEQTLANPALTNRNGNNTIAAEFRITDTERLNDANNTNPLRVTSQNFHFQNDTVNVPAVTPYQPSRGGSYGKPNPRMEAAPAKPEAEVPAVQNSSSVTTTTTATVSNAAANPSVATGDARPYWLYVSAALVGLLGIFTTFPRRKTKTGEEQ